LRGPTGSNRAAPGTAHLIDGWARPIRNQWAEIRQMGPARGQRASRRWDRARSDVCASRCASAAGESLPKADTVAQKNIAAGYGKRP